ncbi:MAG: flippase-like domain-containing protein, partial [Candidatus Latescibacteria bacterium]|nr:flippase-like domain-containing protein [Candidatus Latescibacterota bacterium]
MTRKTGTVLKLVLGLAVSVFFLYLAFRRIDPNKMGQALGAVRYPFLLIALLLLFLSHWLRAKRHRYFLEPIKPISTGSLFSALMVGYMANTLLPAHLGELVRAVLIGQKERIPKVSVLATIAVERIVDVFCLLILMGMTFIAYPFPEEIRLSGYLTFVFAAVFGAFFLFLKKRPEKALSLVEAVSRPLSKKISDKLVELLGSFRDGLVPLQQPWHYAIVALLSVLVWACYAGLFFVTLYAFDFVKSYHLPWSASLVVLVITTVSIVVPSSPGYVGTYHWLCMVALRLFGVSESPALSFAIVAHAISVLPVSLVGGVLAWKEGISISKVERASGQAG